jgi:hypothetical protein
VYAKATTKGNQTMIVEVKITVELDTPKPCDFIDYAIVAEGSDQAKSLIASETSRAIIYAVKKKLNDEGYQAFYQEDDYGNMGYHIDHSFPYGH